MSKNTAAAMVAFFHCQIVFLLDLRHFTGYLINVIIKLSLPPYELPPGSHMTPFRHRPMEMLA